MAVVILHLRSDLATARAVAQDTLLLDSLGASGEVPVLLHPGMPHAASEGDTVMVLVTNGFAEWLLTEEGQGHLPLVEQLAAEEGAASCIAIDAGGRWSPDLSERGHLDPLFSTWLDLALPSEQGLELRVPAASTRGAGPEAASAWANSPFSDDDELVFRWEGLGGARSGGTESVRVLDDDLVFLEWSDGSTEWMRADDYARDYPEGPAAHRGRTRGLAPTAVKLAVQRVRWESVRETLLDWLGSEFDDLVDDVLAKLKDKAIAVASDVLIHRLTILIESGLARRRATQKGVQPPDSLVDGELTGEDLWGRVQPGTLFWVSEGGVLLPLNRAPSGRPDTMLLMVHGTFLPTELGFAGLLQSDDWKQLHQRHGGHVYAYQHRQWSFSPIEHAADLLQRLSDADLLSDGNGGPKVTLFSHSRGGQVAEVLCGTSMPADPSSFTKRERAALEALGGADGVDLRSRLRVARFVRVAGTIGGTSLMSDRMARVLTAVDWMLRVGVGAVAPVAVPWLEGVFKVLKWLLKVLRDPARVPGLASQSTSSPLVHWLNAPVPKGVHGRGELLVVAGDATGGGFPGLPLVMRAIFGGRNDLVVDTENMRGGWPRREGQAWLMRRKGVGHGAYFEVGREKGLLKKRFVASPTRGGIVQALLGQPADEAGFELAPARALPELPPADRSMAGYLGMLPALDDSVPAVLHPRVRYRGEVVLVPGIMGTHLHVAGRQVWASLGALARGRVRTAPYDWRIGFDRLGVGLRDAVRAAVKDAPTETPVHIVAHSMGGWWRVPRALVLRGRSRLRRHGLVDPSVPSWGRWPWRA